MTDAEAYTIVVGRGTPEPFWAVKAMPKDVSYGRRDGEFFVEGHVGQTLGIALAEYTRAVGRVSDFKVHYLPHEGGCGGNWDPNCECRRWAVYFKDEMLTRHYDRGSAEQLQNTLDRNRAIL